jgi:hypothetical protein
MLAVVLIISSLYLALAIILKLWSTGSVSVDYLIDFVLHSVSRPTFGSLSFNKVDEVYFHFHHDES